jgi:hypothetical protein
VKGRKDVEENWRGGSAGRHKWRGLVAWKITQQWSHRRRRGHNFDLISDNIFYVDIYQ